MSGSGIDMDRQVGARIQRERERVGLSLADLAAQVDVPASELQAVELGQSRPEPAVLLDVANRLGVPLSDLLKPLGG